MLQFCSLPGNHLRVSEARSGLTRLGLPILKCGSIVYEDAVNATGQMQGSTICRISRPYFICD